MIADGGTFMHDADRVQELHDALLEAERDLGLFELRARGIPYWHLIRYNVFGRLLTEMGLHGPRHLRARRLSEKLLEPLRHPVLPYARRLSWSGVQPVDLLVLGHDRQERRPGGWCCPFTYDLVQDTDYRRLTIQNASDGVHLQPPEDPTTRYIELPLIVSRLRILLPTRRWAASDPVRLELSDRMARLGRAIDQSIDVEGMEHLVRDTLVGWVARLRLYRRLLGRTRPRCILLVVHYGQKCLPMVAAAKERKIPVVEVQHGTIGPTHLAYNFAEGVEPPLFPDYFLGFGSWWREISPRFGLPAERFLPVGFSHLERSAAGHRRVRSGRDVRQVIFISQGTIGEELSRMAVSVAGRLRSMGIRIVFRLHPGERPGWRQRYPWLSEAPVDVDDTETDLYAALTASDVQVGVYSTAVYEGYALGLPSVITALPGYEMARPLVDAGLARLARTPEELADAIVEARPPDPSVAESMWTPHPTANAHAALRRIMGEPAADDL